MEIKQMEATVTRFFVYSHIKYHSGKDAAAEISTLLNLEVFNLHVHTRQEVQDINGKLYQMNNQSVDVKAIYPHTRNWIFVPFRADSSITEQHIALMACKMNIYLCNKMTISVTGLCQNKSIITVPGTTTEVSFHCWFLSVKSADKLMQLFSAIEKDPHDVYYFVTKKFLGGKAEH
eukprot:7891289-Ditylum_brightwellii.AAC.1